MKLQIIGGVSMFSPESEAELKKLLALKDNQKLNRRKVRWLAGGYGGGGKFEEKPRKSWRRRRPCPFCPKKIKGGRGMYPHYRFFHTEEMTFSEFKSAFLTNGGKV